MLALDGRRALELLTGVMRQLLKRSMSERRADALGAVADVDAAVGGPAPGAARAGGLASRTAGRPAGRAAEPNGWPASLPKLTIFCHLGHEWEPGVPEWGFEAGSGTAAGSGTFGTMRARSKRLETVKNCRKRKRVLSLIHI